MAGEAPSRGSNPTPNGVQRTRAWSGFWVVFAGDLAIAAGAIVAVWMISHRGTDTTSMVAILTSAFTAISTMTTAYFGIKTMSNTAQSFAVAHGEALKAQQRGPSGPGPDDGSSAAAGSPEPRPPAPSGPVPGSSVRRAPAASMAGPVARPPAPTGPPRVEPAGAGRTAAGPAGPVVPADAADPR